TRGGRTASAGDPEARGGSGGGYAGGGHQRVRVPGTTVDGKRGHAAGAPRPLHDARRGAPRGRPRRGPLGSRHPPEPRSAGGGGGGGGSRGLMGRRRGYRLSVIGYQLSAPDLAATCCAAARRGACRRAEPTAAGR